MKRRSPNGTAPNGDLIRKQREFEEKILHSNGLLLSLARYYLNRYRLLHDMEPEDLVQETLMRAWANFYSFDPKKGRLENWLGAILVNIAKNHMRRISRKPMLYTGNSSLPETASDEDALEKFIADGELKKRLAALEIAIRTLPPHHRKPLKAKLKGKQQAEIARELGIPLGTVKSRLNRARAAVAAIVAEADQ